MVESQLINVKGMKGLEIHHLTVFVLCLKLAGKSLMTREYLWSKITPQNTC